MISDFLNRLETSGINYVHWKNNAFIEEALSGDDDFDILVDPKQKKELFLIFKELKIIKGKSYEDKWHDEIIHYFGVDIETKKIFHIHLHFSIEIAYDYDLQYRLPIVDKYLEDSICYKGKVNIPNYENEYVLLVLRTVLKKSIVPFLLMLPNRQFSLLKRSRFKKIVEGSSYEEFLFLRKRISINKISDCLENNFNFLSKNTFKFLEETLLDNSNIFDFFKANRKLKIELKKFRKHNSFVSFYKSFLRLYKIRFYLLLNKARIYSKIEGKKPENGGRIIAFIGGDGAGKTTTIANLKKTLKKHFSLKSIHVGKPKMTFKGLFLRVVSKFLRVVGAKDLSKALFFLAIAYNRKNEFKKACKLRDKGIIVLQDRIPLEGITAMDCPRVHTLANGKYRKISTLEKKQYKSIKGVDMLFVMKLDPKIALQRRPEDDPDELRIRSGQIWNNDWVAPFAHEINTGENNPVEVQNILLKKVWKNFNKPFIRAEILGVNGTGKSTLLKRIEVKIPNIVKTIPIKKYPFLVIKGMFFNIFKGINVYRKTKHRRIAMLFFHFKTSLYVIRKWKSNEQFPNVNFVFDQGPYFQISILYREKCIDKNEYLKYIDELYKSFPLIFSLTASNEVLYNRVINRKKSDGRGHHLNFEDFCVFCEDYDKCFKVIRENVGLTKKINTEKKSLKKIYKTFKKKAYGC